MKESKCAGWRVQGAKEWAGARRNWKSLVPAKDFFLSIFVGRKNAEIGHK